MDLAKIKNIEYVKEVYIEDTNIIVITDIEEKYQLGWNILSSIYTKDFNNNLKIVVK